MELIIKGKNFEVVDSVRRHAQRKLGNLDHYLPDLPAATVEFVRETTRSANHRYVVQVTINHRGTILRGEERAADVITAIDSVADVIKRQVERYKGKLYGRAKGAVVRGESGAPATEETEEAAEQATARVVKVKRFPLKPMTEDEAAEQMELLGHNFLLFINASTGKFNVIYRRNDGDYGLIEPELA